MFHGIIPSVRAKDDASTLGCRQAVRHQTLTLTCVGSNPAIPAKYDPLAQSVEQLPFKQWVWSSNLQRVTKKADTHLGICFLAVWRFEKFNGTVRWTVPWHRLDDANSLPGALAPGQRISSGSLGTSIHKGTVPWNVPWHRLDDANSLPGALAPGQRISAGHSTPLSTREQQKSLIFD